MITQKQFDALKPGDKVLVEATFVYFSVPLAGHETAAGVTVGSGERYAPTRHYAERAAIHSVLPRAFQVGDRVHHVGFPDGEMWEVIAGPRPCRERDREYVVWREGDGFETVAGCNLTVV
jgi:hypothetical protein